MSEAPEAIRSYQRIFRPERRIYSIEGRPLPIPGGVPLRWLGFASGALVAVVALAARSQTVAVLATGVAGIAALGSGGRRAALLAAISAFCGVEVSSRLLAALDWPLRLIVIPAALATLATQATPDGRAADRFALSWLALRLAPRRRSLGRALPAVGARHTLDGLLWVAPDEHAPVLRCGLIRGPAIVSFPAAVRVRRGGLRRRRLMAVPPGRRRRRGELVAERLALGEGKLLEVRP